MTETIITEEMAKCGLAVDEGVHEMVQRKSVG